MTPIPIDRQELPHIIVGACMEVHKHLGPGLSPEAYKSCLAQEFRMKELVFTRDHKVDICYKDRWVEGVCTLDFLVEKLVVVTILCVDHITERDKTQMRNYLRLTGYETGLVVNFSVTNFRDGIKRIIVAAEAPPVRFKESE